MLVSKVAIFVVSHTLLQFVTILHFEESVANSYEVVRSHLYVFIQSAYGQFMHTFLTIVCVHANHIIQINLKSPPPKIVTFSHEKFS